MDWLQRYTTWDFDDQPRKRPRTDVVYRGGGRSVVTDSRHLLAVDDPAAPFSELDMPPAGVAASVRALLSEPVPGDALRTDLGDLWLWLDRIDRERCGMCEGTGAYPGEWNDYPPDCEECDGRGWVFPYPGDPDSFTCTVLGRPIDRVRLAWWLAGELEVYGSGVRVWEAAAFRHSGVPVLAFDGGGWRLAVATLLPESRPRDRYRTYFPGAGLWWQYRRCAVSRLAAADWCAERGVPNDPVTLFGDAA